MYDSIAGVNYQEITLCMTALLGQANYQEITLL